MTERTYKDSRGRKYPVGNTAYCCGCDEEHCVGTAIQFICSCGDHLEVKSPCGCDVIGGCMCYTR